MYEGRAEDIYVRELTKCYDKAPVLDRFDADFPAGSRTAVMGPSGCGKTTLLRLIMGLEQPDAGRISGRPERMTAVFQEDRLCEGFGAIRNLQAVLEHRVKEDLLAAELAAVGLTGQLRQPVRTFSGGMKRRVAIVRACLGEGSLVLLDEPFKGLDEASKRQTAAYIRERLRGRTLIMTTHDREEAALLDAAILYIAAAGRPGRT